MACGIGGGVLHRQAGYGEGASAPARVADARTIAGIGAVLLLSTTLLLAGIESKSFWVDELHSRGLAGADVAAIVYDIAQDLHPPLYFVLLHFWSLLVGRGEFALRFLSVAAGLLSLAATYSLGRHLLTGRVGLLAALLLAISPFFVLYTRVARYYSLTLLLALLSVLVFLRLLRRPSPPYWAAHVALSTLLIYTDYPAVSVLLTQSGVVLGLWVLRRKSAGTGIDGQCDATEGQRENHFLRNWILAQAAIFTFYLPWVGTVFQRVAAGSTGPGADFAHDLSGYIPKLAFPFYSFSVGETLFPWHPAAAPVLLTFGALALLGARQLMRGRPDSALLLLAFLLLPLLSTTLIVTYVATATTFLNIPSRTMFAQPFFILIVATGLAIASRGLSSSRPLPLASWLFASAPLSILAIGSTISLANYHRGEQTFNPIYAVPTREIVQEIVGETRPGDVLVAEADIGFGHYYRRQAGSPPLFDAASPEVVGHLRSERSARVWLATFGRDSTRTGEATASALKEILSREYTLHRTKGYVEQDASYRRFKELLLRRQAYQYKLLVELYVRKECSPCA